MFVLGLAVKHPTPNLVCREKRASLRNLCGLSVSAVNSNEKQFTTETPRTQRTRRATSAASKQREENSALPPDGRRWLCLAVSAASHSWAGPLARASPLKFLRIRFR